jgi:hypothetical protein
VALQTLVARCMVPAYNVGVYKIDTCALGTPTTMTLAYLLAACVGIPGHSSSLGALAGLDPPVQIPRCFRLGWQAAAALIAAGEAFRLRSPPAQPGHTMLSAPSSQVVERPILLSAQMATHPRASLLDHHLIGEIGMVNQPSLRLVLGEADAISKIAGFGAPPPDEIFELAEAADLHIIDNMSCQMREDGPDLQFLLPANHGLDLARTAAVLLDVKTFAITQPLLLNSFNRRTVALESCRRLCAALEGQLRRATWKPPPITGGTRPSLGSIATPEAHSGPGVRPRPALHSMTGPPRDSETPRGATAAQGEPNRGSGKPPAMSVVSCTESSTHYSVELTVTADGQMSRASVKGQYEPGCVSTHRVTITLAQPAGASCDIIPLCPVDAARARITLFPKRRLVRVKLLKSEHWPVDVVMPGMVPKLCADGLEAGWRDDDLKLSLKMMFTDRELQSRVVRFGPNVIGCVTTTFCIYLLGLNDP